MTRMPVKRRRPVFDEEPVYQKTRESGADFVRGYLEDVNSEAYKKATPEKQRKFRKRNEAYAGHFKDVI